jgi:hypothetical protein
MNMSPNCTVSRAARQVNSILNMRKQFTGEHRPTVEVEREVRDFLARMVRRAVPEASWCEPALPLAHTAAGSPLRVAIISEDPLKFGIS